MINVISCTESVSIFQRSFHRRFVLSTFPNYAIIINFVKVVHRRSESIVKRHLVHVICRHVENIINNNRVTGVHYSSFGESIAGN